MSQGMTTADGFRMLEPPSSRFQWWSTVVYCRKVWRVNKRCFSGTSACRHLMNRNAHHITRRWFSWDIMQRRRLSARPFPTLADLRSQVGPGMDRNGRSGKPSDKAFLISPDIDSINHTLPLFVEFIYNCNATCRLTSSCRKHVQCEVAGRPFLRSSQLLGGIVSLRLKL